MDIINIVTKFMIHDIEEIFNLLIWIQLTLWENYF